MDIFASDSPWVLFRLNQQLYGIPASYTQEMVTIPEVTPIPRSPDFVRGLINLRGSVIALIDLRMKLDQPSMDEELESFIKTMRQRQQEHIEWVDALEKTIETGVPFTQIRDPHQCAFGKWYDNYNPQNPQLSGLFLRFDAPHKAIHAAADQVESLLAKNQKEKAEDLLQYTRKNHLEPIIELFGEMEKALYSVRQEVAIVVEHSNTMLALTVDAVDAVETLKADSIENLPGNAANGDGYIISMLGLKSSDNQTVLIPDLARIVKDSEAIARMVAQTTISDDASIKPVL
jgi:purine-binding chemotaxis protein CheW